MFSLEAILILATCTNRVQGSSDWCLWVRSVSKISWSSKPSLNSWNVTWSIPTIDVAILRIALWSGISKVRKWYHAEVIQSSLPTRDWRSRSESFLAARPARQSLICWRSLAILSGGIHDESNIRHPIHPTSTAKAASCQLIGTKMPGMVLTHCWSMQEVADVLPQCMSMCKHGMSRPHHHPDNTSRVETAHSCTKIGRDTPVKILKRSSKGAMSMRLLTQWHTSREGCTICWRVIVDGAHPITSEIGLHSVGRNLTDRAVHHKPWGPAFS